MKFSFAILLAGLSLNSFYAEALSGYDAKSNEYFGVVQNVQGEGYQLLESLGLCDPIPIVIDMFCKDSLEGAEDVNVQKSIELINDSCAQPRVASSLTGAVQVCNASDNESNESVSEHLQRSITPSSSSNSSEPSTVPRVLRLRENHSTSQGKLNDRGESVLFDSSDNIGLLLLFQNDDEEENKTLVLPQESNNLSIEVVQIEKSKQINQSFINLLSMIRRQEYDSNFGLVQNLYYFPIMFSSRTSNLDANKIRASYHGMDIMLARSKLNLTWPEYSKKLASVAKALTKRANKKRANNLAKKKEIKQANSPSLQNNQLDEGTTNTSVGLSASSPENNNNNKLSAENSTKDKVSDVVDSNQQELKNNNQSDQKNSSTGFIDSDSISHEGASTVSSSLVESVNDKYGLLMKHFVWRILGYDVGSIFDNQNNNNSSCSPEKKGVKSNLAQSEVKESSSAVLEELFGADNISPSRNRSSNHEPSRGNPQIIDLTLFQ